MYGNDRGTLLNITYEILTKITVKRLKALVENIMGEFKHHQLTSSRLRQGRSTTGQIMPGKLMCLVKMIVENARSKVRIAGELAGQFRIGRYLRPVDITF